MNLARPVAQCIAAIEKFGILQRVVVAQGHLGQVVIEDHGFVRAMHDRFDGKFRGFNEASKLLEGKLEGGCRHGKTVFLEELRGEMVEEVEREIGLHG